MIAPPFGVQDSSFQLFLESIPDGFFAVDTEWRVVGVNAEAERVARNRRTELMSRKLWDLFPGICGTSFSAHLHRAADQQSAVDFEYFYEPWRVWFHVKAAAGPNPAAEGLSIFIADITQRKLIETERADLLLREREAREEAEALNEISSALSSELDSQKLVQLVTDRATKLTGAKFGAFFYNVLNERGESYVLYTLSGASRESFDKFGLPRNTPVFDPTFRGTAVVRSDDITQDPRYGKMGPHHGMPQGHLPVRSYLAVPVIGREGTVLGGLFFAHPEPGVFTARSERLATGIASHAAIAIDNARLTASLRQEIVERKASERAANLLSAIVDSSDDAIISKDLTGIITSWNDGAQRIFGYTAEEMIGQSVLKLIPGDRQAEEPVILARLQRGERIEHFETIRRRKDGRLIDISLTVSPVKDRQGEIIGASKIARDITERKLAEQALQESEARFRQLADAMPQMVWSTGPDGVTDYYNERWYDFTQIERDTFGPDSWEPLLHPEDLPSARAAWAEALRTGQPYRIQYRMRDSVENRWRWFMASAMPVRDAHGQIVRWFGTSTDIDEQKRHEEELRQANQDLEQFAFSASHDLQEPLRTIKIYSELLTARHASALSGEAREFLDFVQGAAGRMELLVRDLLAYTQVSRMALPQEATDAGEALDAALANLQGALDESEARITIGPLPSVRVHSTHLKQLFQNIIGNAVKYRHPDRIPQIHIATRRQQESWLFLVRDNGIGIPPEYKEHIFGLFKRLHSGAEYSGTGIGLAICQRIVERYNGRIWVESEPERGSTFFFTLPV